MSFMQATTHIPALTQTQAGFLADWFTVFWDLYINRLSHRRQHSTNPTPTSNNNQDKRQLIQRFMSVIGLGNRDPATLSEEERQFLMSMVQRYSSQPLAVPSPNLGVIGGNPNPPKRPRPDGAPTGVSMPGQHHHGPIGTFTPQFPPNSSSTSSTPLSPPQLIHTPSLHNPPSIQSLPSDPAAMDRMMANMLSSVIGGTLDPMTLPMYQNNGQRPPQQTRSVSQPPVKANSHPTNLSPNINSRPSSTTDNPNSLYSPDFGSVLNMITPLSLTPPPQPFMDEMESIMLSSGGSLKGDKQEYRLELVRKLYTSPTGAKVTAIAEWNQFLLVGTKDGRLSMVQLSDGQEMVSIQPHSMAIAKIEPFNDHIWSCGHDRLIIGYQYRSGKLVEICRLTAHPSPIHSIACLSEHRLVSCDSEGHILLWKYSDGTLKCINSVETKQVGPNTLYHVAKSEDGGRVAVAVGDEVWILKSDSLNVEMKIQTRAQVSSLSFSQGLLACTGASLCILFDPNDNFIIRHTSPSLPDKIFSCALIDHGGKLMAILGSYQKAFIWVVGTNSAICQNQIHDGIVACVEPYREGMVITAGHDGLVKMIRVAKESSGEQDELDLVLQNLSQ